MSSRVDWFFRQKVTEAELDLAFELLEKADRNLAADIGVFGVISGAAPSQHAPVADLSIDLNAPGRAYDRLGQRMFFGTGQVVDCSVDLVGLPTDVSAPANERWLGVFLRFDRSLSDPRTDGNSQQVFFRRDESFEIVVRQAPEAAIGAASKVALQADEILICEVLRSHGQTQIFDADIDTSRRQAFIFAQGNAVGIVSGIWNVLQPAVNTVQAALDEVDAELNDHFSAAARRHTASDIDYAPHGFVGASSVQAAIDEVVDDISTAATGNPGAQRVGADAVTGTPHALPAGNVDGQLSQILAWLNTHVGAPAGAHNASAIAAAAHNHISGTSVQAQLQEIVDDLQSNASGLGASQVGDEAVAGTPNALASGTVRAQLSELLAHLNAHAGSADHDGRYFTESEADARFYNVGEPVADADTVDGQHASAFATAGHDHDDRYLRRTYLNSDNYGPNEQRNLVLLADRPDLVTVAYNNVTSLGFPQDVTYVLGPYTNDIKVWVTKVSGAGSDKDYRITVHNQSVATLHITIAVYRRD